MLGTALFIAGIIITAIGIFLLIKFDGEIKRAIAGLIIAVIGFTSIGFGQFMRANQNQEVVVIQINEDVKRIRYVEKEKWSGNVYSPNDASVSEGTFAYLNLDYINTLTTGQTITKVDIETNKE